ncbi:50S ribosomal protein L29 [Caldivirga maquilingensis]|uniref:Large ribosomal subunit protein uL29 n=1 Tax=Caldivirga maquilingensis (strain ATCC 700844 / DSM 13496 / JCM 10307 / IC-167) TaxID=397948 RepID=A8MDC2_CALMQ|nr:ribosomal protein L29 [Caldivirga maquilingensis IC-167]
MPEKVKLRDLKNMSREDRLRLLNELRSELIRLETQRGRGVVDNPGRMRYVRRLIARILTIEHETELNDLRNRINELVKKGVSYDKVSMQLGIKKSTLRRILRVTKPSTSTKPTQQ